VFLSTGIIIFEDNDRLRESLAYLLQSIPGYKILGDYNNCMDAENITRVYEPDVVLMDIDMPGESGIKGVRIVKETRPQTAVIMYTVFEDDEKLFQCLCAGANGYLLKKTPPEKIFESIREVMDGGAPMSPLLQKKSSAVFNR
jgi:DNA-binding NarL/FixJ family response regulator